MTTKSYTLTHYLGHCIRDMIADKAFIEEAAKALHLEQPQKYQVHQVVQAFENLVEQLTNLEELLHERV